MSTNAQRRRNAKATAKRDRRVAAGLTATPAKPKGAGEDPRRGHTAIRNAAALSNKRMDLEIRSGRP